MRFLTTAAAFCVTLVTLAVPAEGSGLLPRSFGQDPSFSLAGEPSAWSPDDMYEHIDGEAELVKRYGAAGLHYALYESPAGASLAVDLLDMGSSINAFGLYRLYAGCEGSEKQVAGAVVLNGDFTTYARLGRWFLRVDAQGSNGEAYPSAVQAFLEAAGGTLGPPEPLPGMVKILEDSARQPCEVGYHPEDLDYDLSAGPGYRWISPDGEECFLRVFDTPAEAARFGQEFKSRGGPGADVRGRLAGWSKVPSDQAASHIQKVLARVLQSLEGPR